jgi:uncharacterized membrane protein
VSRSRLKIWQYLVLFAVMLTAPVGDAMLAKGMHQLGIVDLRHLDLFWHALFNPWVDIGILLLIGFFASYMTALSFADLSFVNPATALSYVVTALISHFWLHEQLTLGRWAAIGLIVTAVGFVASGPLRTEAGEVAPLARVDASEGL